MPEYNEMVHAARNGDRNGMKTRVFIFPPLQPHSAGAREGKAVQPKEADKTKPHNDNRPTVWQITARLRQLWGFFWQSRLAPEERMTAAEACAGPQKCLP